MEPVAPPQRAAAEATVPPGTGGAPAPLGVSRSGDALAVGTVVWLSSELMFFAGLLAAYFTLQAASEGPWPPDDVHLEVAVTGLATLVLVASSVTVQRAVRSAEHGAARPARRWLVVTVALGTLFLANQAREWAVLDFAVDSHAYGSAFYLLTGFHGLHVAAGVAAMALLVAQGRPRAPERAGAGHSDGIGATRVLGYYWHFVDVVWLALYATLYLGS